MPGGRNKSIGPVQPCLASSSRSVEMNGFTVLRDQYMGTPVSASYQYLPHLLSCPTHTALLPPQPRSLDPQAHGLLISQLVSAEDLEPLGTPMLIEDG
ncbi:Nuclear receptor subfamily 6 group A member 1, partial [Ophiophagus hannah]